MHPTPAGIEIEIEIAVRVSADGSTAHIKAPTMYLNAAEATAFADYLKSGPIRPSLSRAHIAADHIEHALQRAHALVDLVARSA